MYIYIYQFGWDGKLTIDHQQNELFKGFSLHGLLKESPLGILQCIRSFDRQIWWCVIIVYHFPTWSLPKQPFKDKFTHLEINTARGVSRWSNGPSYSPASLPALQRLAARPSHSGSGSGPKWQMFSWECHLWDSGGSDGSSWDSLVSPSLLGLDF
jgi:hypothetical protein